MVVGLKPDTFLQSLTPPEPDWALRTNTILKTDVTRDSRGPILFNLTCQNEKVSQRRIMTDKTLGDALKRPAQELIQRTKATKGTLWKTALRVIYKYMNAVLKHYKSCTLVWIHKASPSGSESRLFPPFFCFDWITDWSLGGLVFYLWVVFVRLYKQTVRNHQNNVIFPLADCNRCSISLYKPEELSDKQQEEVKR